MQKKEINEIRRIIRPSESRLDRIYNFYFNGEKNLIFEDDFAYDLLSEREKDLYHEIFKKALSGSLEKNLINLKFEEDFDTNESQSLFYRIALNNDKKDIAKLVENIRDTYKTDNNFAIIIGHGRYDVVEKGKDKNLMDESEETYSFFLMAISETKIPKGNLIYDQEEKKFTENIKKSIVKTPMIGLLYPSFTDRQSNVNECLYYVKDNKKRDEDFEKYFLRCKLPQKVTDQREKFKNLVEISLKDKASFDNILKLNEDLEEFTETSKSMGQRAELDSDKFNEILTNLGGDKLDIDNEEKLMTENLLERKYRLISDEGIKIDIDKDAVGKIIQKNIDGSDYLLIPTEGMDLNGININKK